MKRLFGTSGIRGLITEKMSPENCVKFGLTLASLLNNEGTVVVGYDHRPQAIIVKNALISGLMAGGIDVIDVGIVPTPAILYYVKESSPKTAVAVTGSHTLPEIIGILFFNKDTSEFSDPIEEKFEEIYFKEKYKRVPWNRLGRVRSEQILDVYKEKVLALIDESKVSGRKVVVDPGNGVSSMILGNILRDASVNVLAINDFMDPYFRGRDPFPRVDNLNELGKMVKCWSADLGVGVDGDGDRALFSDELGNVYWGDITGAIFAESSVKMGGKKVVVTINTSHVVSFAVARAGGEVIYSKVGPPAIADTMKKHNAAFGIEESGKYLWSDAIYYGDAALATLRMLEILDREGMTLSELARSYPKFYMEKIAIKCGEKDKSRVMEEASNKFREMFSSEIKDIITIDGIKIILKDGSGILFRPSGTEPVFRVFAESREEKKAKELIRLGSDLVNEVLRSS